MNSLSLNPRFDIFRLNFPKELIPNEIYEKWSKLLNKNNKNVFREPIDVINECIQTIEIPGVSEGVVEQTQTMRNTQTGRVEPLGKVSYRTAQNPLNIITNKITVTFRHMYGFYSYFLLMECWYYHHSKTTLDEFTPLIVIDILDEEGHALYHIKLSHPIFESLDSLSLSFNKVDRSAETFNCTFAYSDLDFDILDEV